MPHQNRIEQILSESMGNSTLFARQNLCPPPFLDSSNFPTTGGFVDGRFCAPISALPNSPNCCLPCPAAKWAYSDDFYTWLTVVEWLNVLGIALLVFMLISYVVLPVQQTRSHYLSVCLIVAVIMMATGFVVPLIAQPEMCYNAITPNDMYSLTECAWSGAFIVAGGLSTAMWILIRALSMNLQICWDIIPGQKFFYYSQAVGWGVPAILFTATMTFTGVSFRFGRECDVNHKNSMKDFWGPLIGMVGAAGVLQLMTFVHCLRVYLRNLLNDKGDSSTGGSSTGLPSYSSSGRTQNQTARVVWRRLQKVLWLQWRGIAIVTIMVVDVVFFSIVFVWLDSLQKTIKTNFAKVEPWIECLALHPNDKSQCLGYVSEWLVNQPTVIAVLILISLGGFQIFLFVARPSIFPAWLNFIRSKLSSKQEFVSLDARRDSVMRTSSSKQGLVAYAHERGSTFEMQRRGGGKEDGTITTLDIESKNLMLSPTQTNISSPDETYRSPLLINRSPHPDPDARLSGTSSLIGRGRIPPEYLERLTSPEAMGSPPTPIVHYNAISLSRQDSDYFTNHQQYRPGTSHSTSQRPGTSGSNHSTFQRPNTSSGYAQQQQQQQQQQQRTPSRSSMNSERRYLPPHHSFSAPQAPSRHSSMKSVTFDPRDGLSRGGLALNPPSEAGESAEDLGLRRELDRQRVLML